MRIEDDAIVACLHQSLHHVRTHTAQTNHSELHHLSPGRIAIQTSSARLRYRLLRSRNYVLDGETKMFHYDFHRIRLSVPRSSIERDFNSRGLCTTMIIRGLCSCLVMRRFLVYST